MHWADDITLRLKAALVFQGGGIRALFFPGHMVGLAKKGIDNTIAYSGSSGGALVAVGIWAGLTPGELGEFLKSKSGIFGLAPCILSLYDAAQIVCLWPLAVACYLASIPLKVFNIPFRFFPEIYPGCTGRRFESLINEMILLGLEKRGIHDDLILDFFGAEVAKFRPTFRQVAQLQKWIRLANSVRSPNDDEFKTLLEVYPKLDSLRGEIDFDHLDKWEQPKNNILDLVYGRKTAHDPYFPPIFISTCCVENRKPTIFNNMEDQYLDVPIARIIRASAGHPLIFRPKRIKLEGKENKFTDGGLIINFPTASVGRQLRRIMNNRKEANSDRDDYSTLASAAYVTIGLCASDHVEHMSYFGSMLGLLTGDARDQLEVELSSYVPYLRVLNQTCIGEPHSLNFFRVKRQLIDRTFRRGLQFIDNAQISTTVNIRNQKDTIIDSMKMLMEIAERMFPTKGRNYVRCHFFLEAGKTPGRLLKKSMLCKGRALGEFRDVVVSVKKEYSGLIGLSRSSEKPLFGRVDILQAARGKDPKQKILDLNIDDVRHIAKDLNYFFSIPIFDWFTLKYDIGRTYEVLTGDYDQYLRLYESGIAGSIIGMVVVDGFSDLADRNIDILSGEVLKTGVIDSMERVALEISYVLSKEIRQAVDPVALM